MDETDESKQPPDFSPQRVGPTVPTCRPGPPGLEELAAAPAPQDPPEPPQQPPADRRPQRGEQFDWLAPLRNRLIIAGFSLLMLLALTAVVVIAFW